MLLVGDCLRGTSCLQGTSSDCMGSRSNTLSSEWTRKGLQAHDSSKTQGLEAYDYKSMTIATSQDKSSRKLASAKARAKLRSVCPLWAVEALDAFPLDVRGDTEEAGWTWHWGPQAHPITQRAFAAGFG